MSHQAVFSTGLDEVSVKHPNIAPTKHNMVVGNKDSVSESITEGADTVTDSTDGALEEVDQIVSDIPIVDPTDTRINSEENENE